MQLGGKAESADGPTTATNSFGHTRRNTLQGLPEFSRLDRHCLPFQFVSLGAPPAQQREKMSLCHPGRFTRVLGTYAEASRKLALGCE